MQVVIFNFEIDSGEVLNLQYRNQKSLFAKKHIQELCEGTSGNSVRLTSLGQYDFRKSAKS